MAKIKINKLPKGFILEDGKIKQQPKMKEGGMYVTGDQADYGLVTLPQEYYGSMSTAFNDSRDDDVRFSLSSVPRENANVEAEGGETVLTDLNNDGTFGLYDIRGPRHSQGGVPMFLPEQSFIYSDTPKLKLTKKEMAEFGMESQKPKTPAKLSKNYDLNAYYGELDSQYADNISSRSAELMLQKNMMDLSKLAFMQEAKKNFEDGVPLASHPFLISSGEDPIQFTAQVEEISRKQAEKQIIESLPMDQQEQLAMLQQFLQQASQQQGMAAANTEAPPQNDMQEMSLEGANMDMLETAKMGKGLDNPGFKALPPEAQANIIQNMKKEYGGEKGEEAYLARRDAAIKASMAKQAAYGTEIPSYLKSYQKAGETGKEYAERMGQTWDPNLKNPVYNAENKMWEYDDGTPSISKKDAMNMAISGKTPGPEYYVSQQENVEVEGSPNASSSMANPFEQGTAQFDQYNDYISRGYVPSIIEKDGVKRLQFTLAPSSRFATGDDFSVEDYQMVGRGDNIDIYGEDIQAQGEVFADSPIGAYRGGIFSNQRPTLQSIVYQNQIVDGKYDPNITPDRSSGIYAYGSPEIKTERAQKDFELRWGDVIETIEGFDYSKPANDPQWLEFQNKAEQVRKKEAEEMGIPYVPYFIKKGDKGYKPGSAWDGKFGLHTFNTPRLDVDYKPGDEQFLDLPKEPPPPPLPPPEEKPADWWIQDINNIMANNAIEDNLYLPFSPALEREKVDYVLDDYTGRVNTNIAAANTLAQGMSPSDLLKSGIFGKILNENQKVINQVNTNNVRTMNQVAARQAMLDTEMNIRDNKRVTDLYDNTVAANQASDNFQNWKTMKNNELFNAAITNRANTANLNSLYDYYDIDPRSGGIAEFDQGKMLQRQQPVDTTGEMIDEFNRLNRQGFDISADDFIKFYTAGNPAYSQNNNQLPGMEYVTDVRGNQIIDPNLTKPLSEDGGEKGEKKLKRFAVPFYTGKMGG